MERAEDPEEGYEERENATGDGQGPVAKDDSRDTEDDGYKAVFASR